MCSRMLHWRAGSVTDTEGSFLSFHTLVHILTPPVVRRIWNLLEQCQECSGLHIGQLDFGGCGSHPAIEHSIKDSAANS